MKEYENWLLKTFNIQVTEENKKYFFGVVQINMCNNDYCSNVLAFKGDPLISFMVCDRTMENKKLTNDRKLTNFTLAKESMISDKLFERIFIYYDMKRFTDHNASNNISEKAMSSCIEALIYATYKSFDIDRAWSIFTKLIKDTKTL